MSELIDRTREKLLSRRADDEIQHQRYQLLTEATDRVTPLIERCMKNRIEEFSQKVLPNLVIGPEPAPTGSGFLKVRVQKMPLHGLNFKVHTGRIEIRRFVQRSIEDSLLWTEDVIQIKVDFNADPWFEYQGKKFVTIDEVVDCLLAELFDAAIA